MAFENKQVAKLFDSVVEGKLNAALSELEETISKTDKVDNLESFAALLREANSYIKLVCGPDESLYNQWRYRLFTDANGKLQVVQGGIELNVEYYPEENTGLHEE